MSQSASARLKKNVPLPYTNWLPDEIKRNVGKWADRKFHKGGIVEHISESGDHVFTVKMGSPPNIRYSTDTLRKMMDVADKHGTGYFRFTRTGNVEFLANTLDAAHNIQEAVRDMGYFTGGWGNTLWSIGSCTAYLTCTTAVTDSTSMTKVLYDELVPYFTGEETLPARLKINVAGCPTACGGIESDIVVVGHYGAAPTFEPERTKLCLPVSADTLEKATPEVVDVCPVSCIKAIKKPDNSVTIEIDGPRCIACGRCKDVCDGITWDTSTIGVSVLIGGKSTNTGGGPSLAKVLIPWIPATPPDYIEVVAVVRKIIDTWKAGAKPGERIADYVNRMGFDNLVKKLNIPPNRWLKAGPVAQGFGVRQFFNVT